MGNWEDCTTLTAGAVTGVEGYWRKGWLEGRASKESIGTIVINKKLVEFRPDMYIFPQPGIFFSFLCFATGEMQKMPKKLWRQFPEVVKSEKHQ